MENEIVYPGEAAEMNSDEKKESKHFVALMVVVVILASAGFGWLSTAWGQPLFLGLQLLFFLVLGVFSSLHWQKQPQGFPAKKKWLYTLFLSVLLVLVFACTAYVAGGVNFLVGLAAACAFLLPIVISELWWLHEQISYSDSKIWYPSEDLLFSQSTIYINSLPIQFKIKLTPQQKEAFTIQFRASERMNLGECFYDMVQKQNKNGLRSFALANDEQKPYAWIFYTKDFLGWNRNLDPDASLVENKISKSVTIYVHRVAEAAVAITNNTTEVNESK